MLVLALVAAMVTGSAQPGSASDRTATKLRFKLSEPHYRDTAWSHQLDFELRLAIGDDPLPRTQVVTAHDGLVRIQEEWRVSLESAIGAETVTWTAASTSPWLVVSPTSGNGSATLTIFTKFSSALAASQTGRIDLTVGRYRVVFTDGTERISVRLIVVPQRGVRR